MRVIAIDGPAGSGKSTIARLLARRLGLEYLDTGAMYRAVTFAVLRAHIDPLDAEAVAAMCPNVAIQQYPDGTVLVDGVDASAAIRGPEVSGQVSAVAANSAVRADLRQRQREWVEQRGGGVVEGRDIGSVVFPEAEMKVYLTARPEVRAARRAAEHSAKADGTSVADVDVDAVRAELDRRDHHDSTRDDSPLTLITDGAQIDGAQVVDTSELTIDEVVESLAAQW